MIKTVSDLAKIYGVNSLYSLGKAIYDDTDCGVSTRFVSALDIIHYEDGTYNCERPIPNIWSVNSIEGIEFSTIVEGYDAEFTVDTIYFPCTMEDIQEALDYLEEQVDDYTTEANLHN